MFADTEGDPSALVQISKFTCTASARINIKRIAEQTVACCLVNDASELRRAFPFELFSFPSEADLDE